MIGKIFRAIGAIDDAIDLALADDETKGEFYDFQTQYPWATYKDWWDLQAHKNSAGRLPNPMQSDSWKNRQKSWQ